MTRRALVTGGAGFIGSHVADLLLQEGYEVEILDNLSSGRRKNLPQGAVFHQLDIVSEEAGRVVRDGRFDALFHLAAQIDVRKSVTDPLADSRINILGSLNLLEAVRASGHQTRFVFSSTGGAIYGDFVPIPSVEDMPKDPESPYGVALAGLLQRGRVHQPVVEEHRDEGRAAQLRHARAVDLDERGEPPRAETEPRHEAELGESALAHLR